MARLAGDLRVGANAILAKVEGGVSISGGTEDPLQHLLDLRKRFPPECWRGPVIVAVDEAQSLPGDEHGAHALFLQAIHRASTALPVTLVLAGLGDTVDRVGEMGLTRGRMDHAVGCFEDSDMVGVMRLFCERFGMNPTAHGDRLDALALPTEGWPRHIHFALQALGRQALAARGDLERVDWNRALLEAEESRDRYYRAQQSAAMRVSKHLVARVLQNVPGTASMTRGVDEIDVLKLLEANVADDPGSRLPKGLDAEDFFWHLVHQGALQENPEGLFHCPIPSFRTYLVRSGGLEPDDRRRSGLHESK